MRVARRGKRSRAWPCFIRDFEIELDPPLTGSRREIWPKVRLLLGSPFPDLAPDRFPTHRSLKNHSEVDFAAQSREILNSAGDT
jgi:hypothetical protein